MKSILCLMMLVIPSVAFGENLLVNGSFESPVVSTGSNENFSGDFTIPGWSGYSTGDGTTSGSGIVNGDIIGPPPLDGSQDFAFNGGNPPAGSYVQQVFSTTVGQEYALTYSLYRFNDQSVAVQLDTTITDSSSNTLLNITAIPLANAGWTSFTEYFTSDTTSSTLTFTDTSPSNPNTDLFIDDVSVTAAPEPTTVALMVSGSLGLLIWGGLRKRTQ